jgi:hypothetical protein
VEKSENDLNAIDLCVAEVEGIMDVLVFIELEADPPQRHRLTDAIVTLLHVAIERLQKAAGRLENLKAAA